jgi:DNA invertase Pin-like site-specific DNA recombinase
MLRKAQEESLAGPPAKLDVRASSMMVFTVLGAVAELERSLIAERVKAGLDCPNFQLARRAPAQGA